jgi:dolichol kinase
MPSAGRASSGGGGPDELHELVGRTRGPQPWRKLFHAVNGITIAVGLTTLPLSRGEAVAVFGGILSLLVALDVLRLRHEATNRLFFLAFSSLASPREAKGVASSTWYTLGALLTVALFSRAHAVSGVLVLALADPAASYVGQRWGSRPLLAGTLLGSAAFFLVALAVLAARHPLPVALVASVAVALAERLSWPLDDNLTIPIVGAAVLTGLGALS